MTSYVQLSKHRRQFLSMTGYTVEEFQALLPHFSAQFQQHVQHQTLVGKKRNKRRYSTYQNSPLSPLEDKLLFILIYLRKAATQDLFGELFGMQQPVANKWIHFLHPVLNATLANLGKLPARNEEDLSLPDDDAPLYFHDGTERPIHRPKDPEVQGMYYSGKKNSIRSKISSSSMPSAR